MNFWYFSVPNWLLDVLTHFIKDIFLKNKLFVFLFLYQNTAMEETATWEQHIVTHHRGACGPRRSRVWNMRAMSAWSLGENGR